MNEDTKEYIKKREARYKIEKNRVHILSDEDLIEEACSCKSCGTCSVWAKSELSERIKKYLDVVDIQQKQIDMMPHTSSCGTKFVSTKTGKQCPCDCWKNETH